MLYRHKVNPHYIKCYKCENVNILCDRLPQMALIVELVSAGL